MKRQQETGGGTLSKAEQRIVKSLAYTDLATKLGISAFGNAPRTDSDALLERPVAPTQRLERELSTSTSMYLIFMNISKRIKCFDGKFFSYQSISFMIISFIGQEDVDLTMDPDFMDAENDVEGDTRNVNAQETCKYILFLFYTIKMQFI